MKQFLFILFAFLLPSVNGYGQNLIGCYRDGGFFSEADTLKDGTECTFRFADNRVASWQIELSPYNDNTILQTAENSTCIKLVVAPPDGKNNLRTAWWSCNYSETRNKRILTFGRVCVEDDAGCKDTLHMIFEVTPKPPKILSGTAKNVYYDADYDVFCDAEFNIQLQLENTNMIWHAIYDKKNDLMPISLTPVYLENTPFSGIYNLHIPYCAFGYMCFGAHNEYGDACLSDTILNVMMIEDEHVRDSVLSYYARHTGIDTSKSYDVEIAKNGRELIISNIDVEEIRLINLQGRIVAQSFTQRMPLPSGLPHGCYIVSVKHRGRGLIKNKVML